MTRPVIRPKVVPAVPWPLVVREPWRPTFLGYRGDGKQGHLAWALYIDGELVHPWDWVGPPGAPRADGVTMEWAPKPIDPRDWPPGEHEIRVTLFADGPDPNEGQRVQGYASATVRFEHEARLPPEAPVTSPRHGKPVANVGPFFVAPFYHGVRETLADPARREAYHAAGLWTHTESVHAPLGPIGHAAAMGELRRDTAGFREYFAAHPRAGVVLIWDNLPMFEYAQTLANPDAPRIIADALAYWQEITNGRVRWLRVLDEAAMKWGTPPPAVIRQCTAWLRGPCERLRIPFAWSGGGGVPAPVNAEYAHLTGAFDLYSLHGQDDGLGHPEGYTTPRVRASHDRTWRASLEAIRPDVPLAGLVSVASFYYTKGDSDQTAAYYRPGIDILHFPGGRARATVVSAALKLLDGACGVSAYFDDTRQTVDQRRRETFPHSVLPEPCQTGCSPFATGAAREMWEALGAVQRFADAIGPRLFARMSAPALELPPGVRASQRGDDVVLLLNTREAPATVRWTGPARRRLRLDAGRFREDTLDAGAPVVLLAGECTALIAGDA